MTDGFHLKLSLLSLKFDNFPALPSSHSDEKLVVNDAIHQLKAVDSWWVLTAFELQEVLANPPFLICFASGADNEQIVLCTRRPHNHQVEEFVVGKWPGMPNTKWPIHTNDHFGFVEKWTDRNWEEIRPSYFEFEYFDPETRLRLIANLESWLKVGWFSQCDTSGENQDIEKLEDPRDPDSNEQVETSEQDNPQGPNEAQLPVEASQEGHTIQTVGGSKWVTLKAQLIRERYYISSDQIRNWAKSERKPFIETTNNKGYYRLDAASEDMKSLEKDKT